MSTTQPIRNEEQLQKFKSYYLEEKPNGRNYMLIIVGLNSALRISDILHLTYEDVYDYTKGDWKKHINVREQKTGKTNRIYVNQEIKDVLTKYTEPKGVGPNSWLFIGQMQKNKPLSRYQAFRAIKEAASYAGIEENISCHSLRKTFGYHAWKQGTPPALLMNIYNHSTFQVTKRYLGIEQDDRDEVFANIKI